MINSSITNNLSTAPIQVSRQGLSAASFQPTNNPQDVVQTTPPQSGSLVYPSDRPKYFMQFDIMDYHRDNLNSVGTLRATNDPVFADGNSIILPMAQTLRDVHQCFWDDKFQVGTVSGGAVQLGANALHGGINPTINKTAEVVGADVTRLLEQIGVGGVAGGAEAILGLSPNKFMTVLFIGPLYKRHNFTWMLSANSPDESETLRKIVKTFNNAMSPSLGAAGMIWAFPKVIRISINPNTKFMYKFKPCVLESFEANYTPAGRAAFYTNSGLGDNPPEGLVINMRFIELEYWLSGDFNDSSDPNAVYSSQPANIGQSVTDAINQFTDTLKKNAPGIFGKP